MDMTTILGFGCVALPIASIALYKVWLAKKPSARTVGLGLMLKGMQKLSTPAANPNDVAALAAKQAHEAALLAQVKAAAAALT